MEGPWQALLVQGFPQSMAIIACFLLWAICPPLIKDSETPAWLGLRLSFQFLTLSHIVL